MKVLGSIRQVALITGALAVLHLPAHAEVLIEDGFETGDLSSKTNDSGWWDQTSIWITDNKPSTGEYSAEFLFRGGPPDADAWAQLDFNLSRPVSEVWIRYDVFVPENYSHARPGNNKLLWITDSRTNKTAFEAWSAAQFPGSKDDAGDSYLSVHRSYDGAPRPHIMRANGRRYTPVIDVGVDSPNDPDKLTDDGKWLTFVINVKVSDIDPATNGKGSGRAALWKCHAPCAFQDLTRANSLFYVDQLDNGSPAGDTVDIGYFFGWSNSGFNEDTILRVDNVVFATDKAEVLEGPDGPSPIPLPPVLQGVELVAD